MFRGAERGILRFFITFFCAPAAFFLNVHTCRIFRLENLSSAFSSTGKAMADSDTRGTTRDVKTGQAEKTRSEGTRHELSLNWTSGQGYDSNPLRMDPCTGYPSVSTLFAVGTLDLNWQHRFGPRDMFKLSYLAGGRLHSNHRARGEDVFKHRVEGAWHSAFRPGSVFSLSGLYWESWERKFGDKMFPAPTGGLGAEKPISYPSLQDYRYMQIQPSYFAALREGTWASVTLSAASFDYRPVPALGFQSAGLGSGIRHRGVLGTSERTSTLDLSAHYSLDMHFYPEPARDGAIRRRDALHVLALEGVYVGSFLAGVSYNLRANLSSDKAWTLTRHTITARGAINLPLDIIGVLKGVYQHLSYSGTLLIYTPTSPEPFMQLDEETRSSILVSLQREVMKGLAINLVYKVYLGRTPAACGEPYVRHVTTLEFSGSISLLE